jgi:hypothetical protein
MWFYVMIVSLIIVLMMLTRVREQFVNPPAPQELFKKVRELLDRYDNPEMLGQAAQVMNKDPGELARMFINRKPE